MAAAVGGGDALLQLAHLGRQRGLVADRARHAAEQRRDLGAGLREAEDVVDEEQHVGALGIAEVLRHRQARQGDAQTRSRRLVHLAVDERRAVDHARLGHLEPEVVALTGALADAGEHRLAGVELRDVVDQLLDQHRLADAGAAEQADLAAAGVRREQVDDLDAGLEDLRLRLEVLEQRRRAVDRPALGALGDLLALVDRLAQHVEDAAQRDVADGHRDGRAGVDHLVAAGQALGGVHRDRADAVVAQVLLHLGNQDPVHARDRDVERVVDRRQLAVEHGVEHDALDLNDPADVRSVCHVCAGSSQAVPETAPGGAIRYGVIEARTLPESPDQVRLRRVTSSPPSGARRTRSRCPPRRPASAAARAATGTA